jgi:hypothetical protein
MGPHGMSTCVSCVNVIDYFITDTEIEQII